MIDSSADSGMAHLRRQLMSISESANDPSARPFDVMAKNGKKSSMPLVRVILVLAFGAFVLLPSMVSMSLKSLSKDHWVSPNFDLQKNASTLATLSPTNHPAGVSRSKEDYLLGGLVLDDPQLTQNCRSRAQQHLYRKASRFLPSNILISRLRNYEALHRKCAGDAKHFVQIFKSPGADAEALRTATDCRFAVWIAWSGLGNRLMTLVATFLYALLTDRILLVDRGTDMSDLFCEPFPNSSWFLPVDFPQSWLEGLNRSNPYRFGHLIDKGKCSVHVNVSSIPVYSYVDLTHSFDLQDRRFFCEEEQKVLNQIPWLFLRTNIYFVPSLYFVPPLNKKLEKFFPQREALFHHLARYLFHPSNDVWGRIIRFYDAYLSNVDQIVGLQIRIFDPTKTPTENVTSQVFACVLGNKILPNTSNDDANEQPWAAHIVRENKVISVLVTSLHQGHYDSVRKFYLHQPTEDGSLVRVNLPSHEGEQRTDKPDHDKQALAEIFLLSFSDTLVTSPMSTFGYAAQGLAGIRPWLLTRPGEDSYQNFACMKAFSVEPCFHVPPLFDCDCQGGTDPGKIIPFVRHCEDVRWGLKLSGDDVSETNFSA